MDNVYVRKLRVSKRLVGKKLYAAVALLLVASLLVSTATYAWLTLSLAPEATDITTTIGANGNFEIALATTDHLASLEANNMYDDDSNFEYTTGDPVHDNVLWGNLIDLTAVDYGLHVLNMRPAVLNVIDGTVANMPISVGAYGADGRLTSLNFSSDSIDLKTVGFAGVYDKDVADYIAGNVSMSIDDLKSGNYNKQELVDSVLEDAEYGVRIAGPLEYSASLDQGGNDANINLLVDGYCFGIDLLFRTNAPTGNLMLQTEGVQRMESELEDEYVGNGSFITISNEKLSAAMKVVFANTLTGEVYALAQADSDGKLWITARADENGTLVPTENDDAAMIKPLTQNQVSAVTAWVYIDGSLVDNSAAATKDAMEMLVNLQFSTDTVLNPAYTDQNTNPNYPNRPEMPVNPDGTLSVGEKYVFGSYEQDNNLANGAEPIEWRCLAREGNKVLLISLYGLDAMAYNPSTEDVTWETSEVRSWLNSIFISNAFTETEQDCILTTHLVNDGASKHYGIPEGNSTDDKIFFLSESEALSYFADDEARLATATAYAIANGAIVEDINGVKNITCWWTRTPGAEANSVTLVCGDGAVSGGIYLRSANNESISIRPAMWITLGEQPDNTPDTPVVPEIPTDAEYYLSAEGGNNYTIYSLADDGSCDYELHFTGTLNANNGTITLNHVTTYPEEGVIVPALATLTDSETEYAVCVNPTQAPFADLGMENAIVCFVPVEGKKVSVTSTVLSDLFDHNEGTEFGSLDLSGLNTSTVTNMSEMFYSCQNLTYLNLNGLDTSNVTNMNSMFSNCQRLPSLDVTGFNTSKVTDMSKMFLACYALTSLDLSTWNTPRVTDMSHMFNNCNGLITLDVSGLETNNVTNMLQMFYLCSNVTELDVSNFNTAKCTDMAFMFDGCKSLEILDVSNFNTSNVTIMSDMFGGCSSLTELDVSNFDTSNVTSMINMFWGCRGLTELDVSGFDTSKCTNFVGMFGNCTGVKEFDVSGFVTSQAKFMSSMFKNCSSLKTLDLSNFDLSKAYESPEQQTYINDFLIGCTGLEHFVTPKKMGTRITYLSETFTDLSTGLTYTQLDASTPTQTTLTKVTEITAGTFGDGLTYRLDVSGEMVISGTGRMPDYSAQTEQPWYDYRNQIKTVLINDGMTYIGEGNFFSTGITEISIPRSVEEIGNGAFLWCSQLKNVNYGGSAKEWEALAIRQNNEFLLSATVNCALASVPGLGGSGTLDNGLSWWIDSYGAILTISGNGAMPTWNDPSEAPWYRYSDVIQGVIICDGVTNVSNKAFSGYEKLKTVILNSGVTTIGDTSFSECESLIYVSMPDTLTTIGSYAFYNCVNLSGVVIPESVTTIKDSAFSGCTSLKEIVIPDGITTIAEGAFLSCTNLESVTIPASVTAFEDYAFYGCSNLKHIYFKGNEAQWNAISIDTTHYEFPTSMTIHFNAE